MNPANKKDRKKLRNKLEQEVKLIGTYRGSKIYGNPDVVDYMKYLEGKNTKLRKKGEYTVKIINELIEIREKESDGDMFDYQTGAYVGALNDLKKRLIP